MLNNSIVWNSSISLDQWEELHIRRMYEHHQGNKTKTAQALGISVRTLDDRLGTYEAADQRAKAAARDAEIERARHINRARGLNPDGSRRHDEAAHPGTAGAHRLQPGTLAETERKISEEKARNGVQAEGGVRVESSEKATAQQPMSVPVGKEVQGVLSKQPTGNRHAGRGR